MDWSKYLPSGMPAGFGGGEGEGDGVGEREGYHASQGQRDGSASGSGSEASSVLGRSLSLTERTRLNLSHTWYSLVETLGLQRLKAIMSGVSTLPPSDQPLYLLGKTYESLNNTQAKGKNRSEDQGRTRKKKKKSSPFFCYVTHLSNSFFFLLLHSIEAEGTPSTTGATAGREEAIQELTESFAEDMASRLWVTYRRGFPPMGPSLLTTDAGWGCTIRSGQMMLANCLLVHHLGRDWRRGKGDGGKTGKNDFERNVVSLFLDLTAPKHYLSLHSIVREGHACGIVPGHWVGPYVLCQTFKQIMDNNKDCPIALYLVAEAGGIPTLYKSRGLAQGQGGSGRDGEAEAEEGDGDGQAWKPLLILIPVTLGVTSSINPCYVPQILTVLSMPQSLGIVGGKPGSSVYVVGRQAERILYLDPHTLKPAYETLEEEEALDSYFCNSIHHMLAAKLDPSLALAFYCRERGDFEDLYDRLEALAGKYPTTSLLSLAENPSSQVSTVDLDNILTF